jgi:predicted ATP-dependent Lon-type protease
LIFSILDKEENEWIEKIQTEIKLFVTEFKPIQDDNIIEVLDGRLHFAVKDQLEYMTRGADTTVGEYAKILLKDLTDYIAFNWQKKDSSNFHQITEILNKEEILKRERDSNISDLEAEIKLFVTEFKPIQDDNIIEVLDGRLHFAVKDRLEYMARTADMTIGKSAKILLKDVRDYVESNWSTEKFSDYV